jgi:hypothetical protein
MKENLSNELANTPVTDSIRDKITLLSNAGFVWKEIAALTKIPKRLIKEFAEGKHKPSLANSPLKENDLKWLENQISETIKRLRNGIEALGDEKKTEIDSDIKQGKVYALDIQNLSLYINEAIDDVLIKIEGAKLIESPVPLPKVL